MAHFVLTPLRVVIECDGLQSKSSCYVMLNLQRGSEDIIRPLQADPSKDAKSKAHRDIPEIKLGAIVSEIVALARARADAVLSQEARTPTYKSSTSPQFNKGFHFFLYPSASPSPAHVSDCIKLTLCSKHLLGTHSVCAEPRHSQCN